MALVIETPVWAWIILCAAVSVAFLTYPHLFGKDPRE